MLNSFKRIHLFATLVLCAISLHLSAQSGYMVPDDAIADIVLAEPTPSMRMSPDGKHMLLLANMGYPSIDRLARKELRLAGLRINPANHGPSRGTGYVGMSIQGVGSEEVIPVEGLPDEVEITNVGWSQDSRHVAFTVVGESGISLWLASIEEARAWAITEDNINDVMGSPYIWSDGGKRIFYKLVTQNLSAPEQEAAAADGPVIQESAGSKAAVRTYQDMLQNAADERLFEYYTTTSVRSYDVATQSHRDELNGQEQIIMYMSDSPDGKYLMVASLHKPFSYQVPYYRFPLKYTFHGIDRDFTKVFASIPLAEEIPKGFDAVRLGPRSPQWRTDKPATIYWFEANDGGDPAVETDVRDKVYSLDAPFDGEPGHEVDCAIRGRSLTFGDDDIAILSERMWGTRRTIVSSFKPGNPDSKKVLWDRSYEDRYGDPGSFVTVDNASGYSVLAMDEDRNLFLRGSGASPEGDRPFVRRYNPEDGSTTELWRSEAPYYEVPVGFDMLLDGKIVTRREQKHVQPNYYLRDLNSGDLTRLTYFEHPYPALLEVTKEKIDYVREDGVTMSGTLYLPKGFKPGEDKPLPTFIWAYPREFKSARSAGQVSGSPYTFTRVRYGSAIFWALRGYAVLDNASMPIVGEGDAEPNDSFRGQLVMNAEAAINTLAERGVTDRDRVALGGHSYGAFMTANLLAHSDLFAAGIARSGAYNRTLTPFGFQREERTYWEAPEVYYTMSPFMHAEKINEPILLIHGEADNNSGTFPIQSKRLYAAVKGLGGTARLVMLPYESHGYRAKESILHMLWEQDQWLDKYVKNKNTTAPDKSD